MDIFRAPFHFTSKALRGPSGTKGYQKDQIAHGRGVCVEHHYVLCPRRKRRDHCFEHPPVTSKTRRDHRVLRNTKLHEEGRGAMWDHFWAHFFLLPSRPEGAMGYEGEPNRSREGGVCLAYLSFLRPRPERTMGTKGGQITQG